MAKRWNWQLKRMPYSFALGLLVALSVHLKSSVGELVGYALFGAVTALRFRTLEWNAAKAFIPLAIVLGVTLLSPILDPSTVAAVHGVAFFALLFMSVTAGLRTAPSDPISPKRALALDFLAKRRRLARTLKDSEPIREAQRREVAKLLAINAERQAYTAAHSHKMTEELKALMDRFEAQKAIVDPLTAQSQAVTERMVAEGDELREAREAWRNRNKRMAG
jgi:hypothetical protein